MASDNSPWGTSRPPMPYPQIAELPGSPSPGYVLPYRPNTVTPLGLGGPFKTPTPAPKRTSRMYDRFIAIGIDFGTT